MGSFMTSVEPYSCNHEAFPGVNGLFQTIHSNNERKEQEKNKEIELLNHENGKLKKKEQTAGRMIKIERIVQLVSIIIALILVSILFPFVKGAFVNGKWSDISQYI